MDLERETAHADLRRATRFIIPRPLLREAQLFLRRQARSRHEGWALLAGCMEGEDFRVRRLIVPEQSTSGVHAHVSGDEVSRIADELSRTGECIGIQIHSHPGAAFHSVVDDQEALVTKLGGLSIVVPDFARAAMDSLDHCAIFRLETGSWEGPLPPHHVRGLVNVVEASK